MVIAALQGVHVTFADGRDNSARGLKVAVFGNPPMALAAV